MPANIALLDELRQMAREPNGMDDATFRRLVLAGLAAALEHEHPELMRRDAMSLWFSVGAGVASVAAGIVAWLKK